MSYDVGMWIDHKKAVIVSIAAGQVTTTTLKSDVGPHPHYAGSQERGGEKKFITRWGTWERGGMEVQGRDALYFIREPWEQCQTS